MNQAVRQTHLEFYREHKITPVRYDLSSLDAHLERRFALYARLGLLPVSFKKASVLEVAAGTGHNSLYVAQTLPSSLVLLEPNETAVEYIHQAYKCFALSHTTPEIIASSIEEYSPKSHFDIVLCENWLGSSMRELSLMNRISDLVAEQGMLVLTTISPIGFLPNVLRRFMASYIAPMNKGFQERTELLASAFKNHLTTMSAMTRNIVDWVQDNMINPAYFGLALSIPLLLERLGEHFEIMGSSPAFSEDWRWFKALHGKERAFNQHFLLEYWRKAHNFLDFREKTMTGDKALNIQLEKKALELLAAAAEHEDAQLKQDSVLAFANKTLQILDDFIALLPSHLRAARHGLLEARNLMASPALINSDSVAKMSFFCGLFGRETVYVSLMRMKP